MRPWLCVRLIALAAVNLLALASPEAEPAGDESGAVLPGATVASENLATGVRQDMVTRAARLYRFPHVKVGGYSVRAELAGFQTESRPDVEAVSSQDFPNPGIAAGRARAVELALRLEF